MQGLNAFQLGTLLGIPVLIHSSLLVFLLLFAAEHALTLSEAVSLGLALLTALYLHEVGHLLGARLSAERPVVRSLLLFPYGGTHQLELVPGDKRTPLWFLMGPFINFVAAALGTALFYHLLDYPFDLREVTTQLVVTNAWVCACNLLPLSPLDSGEILRRAGLTTKNGMSLGQSSTLISIGLLISSGEITAGGALGLAFLHSLRSKMFDSAQASTSQFQVKEVMRPVRKLDTFTHGMRISDAVKIALRSWQDHFPVVLGKEVLGVVDRGSLLRARAADDEQYITGLVEKEYLIASPDEPLRDALQRVEPGGEEPLFVLDEGKNLLGMVVTPQLLEVLLVDAVRTSRQREERGE